MVQNRAAKASHRFLRAFFSSALGTGLSRVLGAIRDIAIAGFLGAGAGSDAFWIAFTVPNVFRRFVADEGLTGALLPAVARAESEEGIESAQKLANTTFSALVVVNLVLCILGVLGAEELVRLFASGFSDDPQKFALTVTLTRWLFPFMACVSMVSFAEALLNHKGHFFIPKIAPGLVSGCIAASIFLLGNKFQHPEYALVVGVLVGGFLHVLVTLPVLFRHWGRIVPKFSFRSRRFVSLSGELGKVVLIGILAQVQIIVLRQLASSLDDGSVTQYTYATRVVDLAQGMIAVGIGSALLPTISQAIAEKDWERFRRDLTFALKIAAFFLVPVTVALLCFAEPITSILFRHGKYSGSDIRWTSATLLALLPFLFSLAGINIIKKAYFALDDRKTLLGVGLFGVLLTGGLGFVMTDRFGIVGLGGALSISSVVQLIAYIVILRTRLNTRLGFSLLLSPIGRMLLSCLPVAGILLVCNELGDWQKGPLEFWNLVLLVLGLVLAGVSYLASTALLKVEEFSVIIGSQLKKIKR